MSVNPALTPNRTAWPTVLCTSCGTASGPLSAAYTCPSCEDAERRRRIAADELRSWKRYSPDSFR